MRKLLVLMFLLFALTSGAKAQVSAITITGIYPTCAAVGQSIAVTFTVTDDGNFGTVLYDVLFSASTTATSSAYSTRLQAPMNCSNDPGFNFNDGGNKTNTIVQNVTIPSSVYSGNIIVIAGENITALTCSSPSTFTSYAYPCTPTSTPTSTPTFTTTASPTKTPTFTITQTPTITATNTATATATKTATKTATTTATQTPTVTSTFTSTPDLSPTPTNVNSYTPTPLPTNIGVNNHVVITPTGTITPNPNSADGLYWVGETQPSGGGGGSSATPNATVQSNAPFQLTQIAQFNALQTQVAALQTVVNVQPIGTQTPTATPNATQVPAMIATLTTQMNILLTEVPVPTNSAPPPALATPIPTPTPYFQTSVVLSSSSATQALSSSAGKIIYVSSFSLETVTSSAITVILSGGSSPLTYVGTGYVADGFPDPWRYVYKTASSAGLTVTNVLGGAAIFNFSGFQQ